MAYYRKRFGEESSGGSSGGASDRPSIFFFGKGGDNPVVKNVDGDLNVYKVSDLSPTTEEWARCFMLNFAKSATEELGYVITTPLAQYVVEVDESMTMVDLSTMNGFEDVAIVSFNEYSEEEGIGPGTFIMIRLNPDTLIDEGDGLYFLFLPEGA